MYARSTTVHGDPRQLESGAAYVRDESMPVLRQMPGCAGLSMLAARASGHCIVTTSWRDEQALSASRDDVAPHLERTAEALGGRPEVEEWEIAAMHRVHEAHHAACSRVTWLRTDPDDVQRAVDAVRLSLMPKLDELPGFCSVSVMVRRADGMAVAAVSYDSWADLAEASEGAREFREEFAPARGIETLATGEFDLVLAHLGVPETN
jgi:quinol monooxygenase YgiN